MSPATVKLTSIVITTTWPAGRGGIGGGGEGEGGSGGGGGDDDGAGSGPEKKIEKRVVTMHWYPGPPADLAQPSSGAAASGDGGAEDGRPAWVRVITVTRRSIFVPFDAATTTLLDVKRRVEAESGVAVEWMRLLRGSTALEGPPEALAADLGVRGGVNLYLITRVEGYEYGRG